MDVLVEAGLQGVLDEDMLAHCLKLGTDLQARPPRSFLPLIFRSTSPGAGTRRVSHTFAVSTTFRPRWTPRKTARRLRRFRPRAHRPYRPLRPAEPRPRRLCSTSGQTVVTTMRRRRKAYRVRGGARRLGPRNSPLPLRRHPRPLCFRPPPPRPLLSRRCSISPSRRPLPRRRPQRARRWGRPRSIRLHHPRLS